MIKNLLKRAIDFHARRVAHFTARELKQLFDGINHNLGVIENNTKKITQNGLEPFIEDAHRFFLQFKGINRGKEAVVVATGPSLNQYIPIEGAAHIGVNRAFKKEDIHLDYLFIQDYPAVVSYIKEANSYKNCVKFYGKTVPDFELEQAGAYKYYVDFFDGAFYKHLEKAPLPEAFSVVFSALSFALYTHPKRLYLAGCDGGGGGHFYELKTTTDWGAVNTLLNGYKKFKEFAAYEYPDVEIVSINPVGLKGVFKDIFP